MIAEAIEIWIKATGLFTTVQDTGRMGQQTFGVPAGGAMDRQAAKTANWLLGQQDEYPVLEITLQGPVIRFGGPLQIALTGGDLSPRINDQPAPMYETITIAPDDVLTFGARKNGCRTYLALGGQWQLPEWLGSRGALKMGPLFWPPGSILQKGDKLRIVPAGPISPRSLPRREQPFYSRQLTVRFTPGPEFSWFDDRALDYLSTNAFTLGPDCNRMGYRLVEALPNYRPTQELISSGTVPGTIQVLPSGKPIILLADAQTTGGYPRLANVLDRDLDDLGQLAPGDRVRFLRG